MTPEPNRRVTLKPNGRALGGMSVRDRDIEPTASLHWVAKLFRVLSGLLFVLMALQIVLGLTSAVPISYGVLFAEAVRLLIFAGLLWGAGDLSDLFVKSHHDLRSVRILLARVAYRMGDEPGGPIAPLEGPASAESPDDRIRH
jgi:hypothetical protein